MFRINSEPGPDKPQPPGKYADFDTEERKARSIWSELERLWRTPPNWTYRDLTKEELHAELGALMRERALYLADMHDETLDFDARVEAHHGLEMVEVDLAAVRRAADRLIRAETSADWPKTGPRDDLGPRFAAAKYCDLIEVAEGLGCELVRKGRDYWMTCPFHGEGRERTPSLHFKSPGRGYICYACRAGGDAVNFVARLRGLTNVDALHLLEQLTATYPEAHGGA